MLGIIAFVSCKVTTGKKRRFRDIQSIVQVDEDAGVRHFQVPASTVIIGVLRVIVVDDVLRETGADARVAHVSTVGHEHVS